MSAPVAGRRPSDDQRNRQHEQTGDDECRDDAQREADRGCHADQKRDEQRSNQQSVMLNRSSNAGRAAADLTACHADHSAQEEAAHHVEG